MTVVIIKRVVPINAPKVDINLPTIKIAGPIAATNKPALTIKPCVSGLSDLKPSTNLCNPALNAAATGGNLKPPVKSGDNPRRASFLARMGNMAGAEYKDGEPTRLLLSLKAWGASSKADAKAKARAISERNKAKAK